MKEPFVPVFTDENALFSTQYASALQGIKSAASRCGQHVQLFSARQLRQTDLSAVPDVVILVSISMPLIEEVLAFMRESRRTVVLCGIDCEQFGPDVSCATPSRRAETQQLVNYLYHCGRESIALVGFGLNSINDNFRYHAAMSAVAAWGRLLGEKDVWLWQHDPRECFADFLTVCRRYDAVICPNDVIAICLLNECRKNGIRIPEDLYLASFGNMSLGLYSQPSITSVSMDMPCVGEQTYQVWRFLMASGRTERTSLKITVPSRILVRESTEMHPSDAGIRPASGSLSADRFYNNPVISALVGLDYCLSQRDELDMRIIRSLLDHESYEKIEEKYYISSSTLRYRLHKIFSDSGVASRKEFEKLIHTHLGEGNPFSFVH